MISESERKLVGACGIYCANCGIYQSCKSQDRERQERIAKAIFGEDTEVRPELIKCDGCGGALEDHWSSECKIMLCAHEKGLLACSQCLEFPCKELEKFYSEEREETKKNALRQKEIGIKKWLEEQKKKE